MSSSRKNPFAYAKAGNPHTSLEDVIAFLATATLAETEEIGKAGSARWSELQKGGQVPSFAHAAAPQPRSVADIAATVAQPPAIAVPVRPVSPIGVSDIPRIGARAPNGVPYGQPGSGYHLADGKLYKVKPKTKKSLPESQAHNFYSKCVSNLANYCVQHGIPKGTPADRPDHKLLVAKLEEAKVYKTYVKACLEDGEEPSLIAEWRSGRRPITLEDFLGPQIEVPVKGKAASSQAKANPPSAAPETGATLVAPSSSGELVQVDNPKGLNPKDTTTKVVTDPFTGRPTLRRSSSGSTVSSETRPQTAAGSSSQGDSASRTAKQ